MVVASWLLRSRQIPIPILLCYFFPLLTDRRPHSEDEVIATYKRLIRSLPRANQYLLLYVLDLLSVFARKSDKNLMTAKSGCDSQGYTRTASDTVLTLIGRPRGDLPASATLTSLARTVSTGASAEPRCARVYDCASGLVHVGYSTTAFGHTQTRRCSRGYDIGRWS